MYGRETLAIDVSSSSMKVASVTVRATIQGLMKGVAGTLLGLVRGGTGTARGGAAGDATSVAMEESPRGR